MSQIYKDLTSGPVPPAVPTQFTADDATIAIPAANNLNVFSRDTTDNNVNGIQTTADPNLSDNLFVELTNRLQGTVSTSGAASGTIITFTPTVIGSYSIEYRISVYNETSLLGAGYSLFGAIRFDGVNSIICDIFDEIINEEGTMTNLDIAVSVAGANVLLVGTGYVGQEINWAAVGLYTFIGVV